MPGKIQVKFSISFIAFCFWFFYQIQHFMIYAFFQNNPQMGNFFVFGIKGAFLYLLALLYLSRTVTLKTNIKNPGITWLFFFLFWSGISVLWTQSDSLPRAFSYWAIMFCETVVVFMLFRFGNKEKVAMQSIRGFILGTAVLGLVALFAGHGSDGRMGNDSFLHPNPLGNQFVIAAILSLYMFTYIKKYWFIFFSFFSVLLILTFSKTALISFGIVLVVYVLKTRISIMKKIMGLMVGFGFVVMNLDKFKNNWEQYVTFNNGTAFETVSGRTIIWEQTWTKIKENPIFGHGQLSFIDAGPRLFTVQPNQAHNEALNIWFNYGLIGLIITIGCYLVLIKFIRMSYKSKNNVGELALFLLIYFLIRGLTEAHPYGMIFNLPLFIFIMEWINPYATNNQVGLTTQTKELRAS